MLLLGSVMTEAEVVPEAQKASLVDRHVDAVLKVPLDEAAELDSSVVINVDNKHGNAAFSDGDPSDAGVEGEPDAQGATASKGVAAVDMPLAINGDDLEDLPMGRHWHTTIGLRNIGLPYDEFFGRMFTAELTKFIAERGEAIEDGALDGLGPDHAIEGVFAGTQIVDEP